MALTAPQKVILGILDRFAYQNAAAILAANGGTDISSRIDAAGDEAFENYMKGANASALDATFGDASPPAGVSVPGVFPVGEWAAMRALLGDLNGYLATVAGYPNIAAWLAALRLRVDLRAASAIIAKHQTALAVGNIHGSADAGVAAPGVALADLVRNSTFTGGTSIDDALASPSAIQGRVTVIGSADWTVTATLDLWDGTTKSVAQVILGTGNGGAAGNTYVFGKQAVSSGAASGQKTVAVAATGQFKVGQTVVLTEWTGSAPNEDWTAQETAVIATINSNASLVMEENLLHSYTTSGFVYPTYLGVSAASGSGGTASDRVYFYPAADRRLKL